MWRKEEGPNLGNLRKLVAGKVDESQIAETERHRGVALDEGSPRGVGGELLMDDGVVAQEASMGAEGDAAQVTPVAGNNKSNVLALVPAACFFLSQ